MSRGGYVDSTSGASSDDPLRRLSDGSFPMMDFLRQDGLERRFHLRRFLFSPWDHTVILRSVPANPEPDLRHPRVTRNLYRLAALFILLAVPALALDLPVASWFQRTGLPGEPAKLINLAEVFAHGWGVACIALTVFVLDRAARRRVLRLLTCAFGAGLMSNVLKVVVARHRPAALDASHVAETFAGVLPWVTHGWQQLTNADIQSFPSSHVATATGLAIGLTWLYPHGRWLFTAFVTLTAFQRWQCGAHYVSDTLAGAAVGCLVAGYCLAPRGLGKWFDRWEGRSSGDCKLKTEN
jgi:membrane-associated phospholipid phosphatase